MLFHVIWEFIDTTEEGQKRSLSVFSQLAAARRRRLQRGVLRLQRRDGRRRARRGRQRRDALADDRSVDARGCGSTVTPIVPIEEASSQIANEAVGVPRLRLG